jgi:hypothetical protein
MRKTAQSWLMLIIRSLLFLVFQALIALVFFILGSPDVWNDSAAWWMISVALTDLVCLAMLVQLYQKEGDRFWNVFQIDRIFLKKDILFMLGFLVILGPVGFLPNILSAKWLFGDIQVALDMLVRPLPTWAVVFGLIFFPLLQGIVEIPTYTLYSMPRLEKQGVRPWLAVSLTSFSLSAQHIFVPFLPDMRFIIYRLVMFLPFAILIALVMRWRPRLMPYMAVVHFLMDISIAVMFLMTMY